VKKAGVPRENHRLVAGPLISNLNINLLELDYLLKTVKYQLYIGAIMMEIIWYLDLQLPFIN
jgi:hypothetical protein